MRPATQLALCADDFGMGEAVDQGILHLLARGRLQAVSCFSAGALWSAHAGLLRQAQGEASIGLHFNLSEGHPLSAAMRARHARWPGLLAVLRDSHLGRLPRLALADEFEAQWQAFTAAFGRNPDHVDGHQHVHQLPGVREVVLEALAACPQPPALRNTAPLKGPGFGFKRQVIAATGGRALSRRLHASAWPANQRLLGVYDFNPARSYRSLMQGWLRDLPAQGSLLFCHPALPDLAPAADDAIGLARQNEFSYLGSAAFAVDLATAGVALAPAWQTSR